MGEIESRAMTYSDSIKSVAAEVKEINGTQHLCLFYVSEVEVNEDDLKAHMAATLTEYMVPDAFMRLEVMPKTPNGKIDRKALPVPELKAEDIVMPETKLEQQLFDVAARLLGQDQFGVTTNLIKMGMSSLMAMRMSVAIRQQLNLIVETKDILATPTLRQLAAVAKDIDSTEEHTWEKREYYPITENQRGVYIDWELHRETTQYNIPSAEKLTDMDAEQLRDALIRVVDAHPYLKTRFAMKDGDVVQWRNDEEPAAVELHVLDMEPDSAFFQQRICPFNLLADRLYRIEVYQTPSSVYLFTDFHHTIFDGLSSAVFMSDLQKAYRGEQLQTETYSSYEHSLDEQQLMQGKTYEEAESYFDQLLDGVESLSYPQSQDVEGNASDSGTVQTEIDGSAIRSFCREHGLTENSYFMTVLLQVLHRVTRENSIQILSINNGRTDSRLSNAVGMFVKTLPVVSVMNTEKESKETVVELAKEMQNQFRKTQSLDFYPFTKMVERHHLRSEIMYAYQGGLFENAAFDQDNTMENLRLDTVKFPLKVTCYPTEKDNYGVSLEYDRSLYSQKDMEMLTYILKVVAEKSASSTFSGIVSHLPLIDESEQARIVAFSAGVHKDIDFTRTYMDLFLDRSTAFAGRLAVADDDSEITYRELERRSNLIAHTLIDAGVKPRDFVAVMTERTKEFPVCVFGIHRAGAAYLPLDIEYPNSRLSYMLEDSGASVLITTHSVLEEKRQHGNIEASTIIYLDDIDWDSGTAVPGVNLCRPDGYTYIIYTSGSTGRPKGVVLHQKGLLNYILSTIDELSLRDTDRISSHRSFSFDSHIEDLYAILLLGGSLHIMPSSIRKDLGLIYEFIQRHGITGGGYTTSIAAMLVNTYPDLPVRYISAIGEKLQGVVSGKAQIINAYGPTECTDHISIYRLMRGHAYRDIPIGRPVANNWCFIVDQYGNLLPQGVSGELCIAGIQVGVGYWHQEELTSKVFVHCPFVEKNVDGTQVMMYHTGDLARWNDDGELECLGRIDSQVKLRGYRVELGEIETTAQQIPEIQEAVSLVKTINDNGHLVLYYTQSESNHPMTEESLRTVFKESSLPDYMQPEIYVPLAVMPRLPNGKIDRKALPAVTLNTVTENVAPANIKEQILFNVVSKLLGTTAFGVTDKLHDVGLTSLLAIKLVAQVKNLGINIKVSDVLKQNTIRKILTDKNLICYWDKPYSDDKPIVVLFYFLTAYNALLPLRDKLSEHFSVLVIEPISDHFQYIFKEEDLNEVIEMYTALIDYYVEGKSKVYAFVGHCLAGEVAYRSAIRWQQKTGEQIPVMMLNTNGLEFHRNENMDQSICYLPEQFRKNHAEELKLKYTEGDIVKSRYWMQPQGNTTEK